MKYNLMFETVYQYNTDSSTSQKYNPNGKMSDSTRPAVTLYSSILDDLCISLW